MSHEQNVAGRESVNYDRWGVAPSLTFGLGTENRLNVSYYHLESNDLPDSGIPYGYSNSSKTAVHVHDKPDDGGDSKNFYGLKDRDFRKTRVDISTISFEHDFSDAMTLKNTFRHGNTGQTTSSPSRTTASTTSTSTAPYGVVPIPVFRPPKPPPTRLTCSATSRLWASRTTTPPVLNSLVKKPVPAVTP